jgi:hypothetical protein
VRWHVLCSASNAPQLSGFMRRMGSRIQPLAFSNTMPGAVYHELFQLWCERDRRDEYIGTLVNAYLARWRGTRRSSCSVTGRRCGVAA